MAKEVAIQKRAQIDKATQQMFFAVCGAAIVLGAAIVFSVYFIKWIIFNSKIISEKTSTIKNYATIQKNLKVLEKNIATLSENENLEVIAREREVGCMTVDGEAVDSKNDIGLARTCSALRVIPDALPSSANEIAVFASLNKLFLSTLDEKGNPVNPASIVPGSGNSRSIITLPGLSVVPVNLSIKNTSTTTKALLDTIERSIRNFNIQSAIIMWRSNAEMGVDEIELQGNATAYYSNSVTATLKNKTIYANESKAKEKAKSKNKSKTRKK